MWSMEAWYQIQRFFPDNSKGSRVIVTTRLSNLASNLCSSPFKMEFLDEDESWKLFCGNAFGEKECPLELEGIGRKIVRKCQGLPLSIVVIGGHLRKSYWKKVANLMNPILSLEEGDKCMQIMNLSYEELPIGLKPCFLYMMKFREDELIHVTELLRLWVAEGFVRAKEGLSLEEVAEDNLNDLIDRNLVLVRERKWNGKPEYCGIHGIARELCMKVGKKGKFLRVSKKTDASREQRIVIVDGTQVIDFVDSVEAAPLLRLLRRDKIMELRMSRVCRAGDGDGDIPRRPCPLAGDFEQVNLRYLRHPSYSETSEIRCHPSLISQFWNLQTLIIMRFGIVITAPQDIWYMAQLRHVECYRLYLPDPIPSGHQECVVLQNLQTLNGVWNLRLNEEVCKIIPNVKEMHVSYDVEDCSDYYPDNLGRFSKLESLHLFRPGLVQRLTFPSSLHELHLWDSNLRWEDVAVVVESLPHLGALRLSGVKGCEWSLAEEEEFPRLKYLMIKFCIDLVYWNACSSNFPVLERLEIVELPELIEIPFDTGEIPTLEHITLVNCNVPAAVSALRILMEQDSFGSHDLKLQVNYFRMEDEELFQKIMEEEDLQSYNLHLLCMESKPQVFQGSHFYVS